MDIQQLLEGIAGRVSASASVKNVYGEPVVVGNRTVVPVAQVSYAFGAGGGTGNKDDEHGEGGGGGGRVSASPFGALEVTPEGTRFLVFEDRRRLGAAMLIGVVLGATIMALSGARSRTDE